MPEAMRGLAPAKLVHGEGGRIVRVNLQYDAKGCCSNSGSGLAEEPPEELFINVFRRDSFDEWIGRLESVRSLTGACCPGLICLSFLMCLPCFCPCVCSQIKKETQQWDKAMREWQDEFNRQILEKCGLFVKTQSRATVTEGNEGSSNKNIDRWLAFALTPEDVIALKSEPHVFGDIGQGCGGVNESELCMHP